MKIHRTVEFEEADFKGKRKVKQKPNKRLNPGGVSSSSWIKIKTKSSFF